MAGQIRKHITTSRMDVFPVIVGSYHPDGLWDILHKSGINAKIKIDIFPPEQRQHLVRLIKLAKVERQAFTNKRYRSLVEARLKREDLMAHLLTHFNEQRQEVIKQIKDFQAKQKKRILEHAARKAKKSGHH